MFFFNLYLNTGTFTTDAKTVLLAGSAHKSWYLAARTHEPTVAACRASSAHSQDNVWTFYVHGTFIYSHGRLTEDTNCNEPGCCSDLANLEGNWQLKKAGEGLSITALKLQESQEPITPVSLMDAEIILLKEGRLKLRQMHPEIGEEIFFEFRTR